MKVLQVLPELNSGGVERGTLELAQFLVAKGHQSLVLSNGGRLVSQLENEGSRHLTLPVHRKSLLSLRLIPELVQLFKDEQPDILHLRSRVPGWLCYLAWKKLPTHSRPRLVTTVHGLYSVSPYSAVMTKGEKVICVSDAVQNYVLKNYPKTNPDKLSVVHRGIDPKQYYDTFQPSMEWVQKWHEDFPETEGKTLLTLPGRVTRLKGHSDLFTILKELPEQFHGVIAGGIHPKKESYLASLKNEIKEDALEKRITFTGQRSDLREILAHSDFVFSLSQKPESFGRTTLEALALGTPVIGYEHGGVGEILKALYPAGAIELTNTRAAVDLINSLSHHRASQADSVEHAIESNPFTLDGMLAGVLEVYQDLLSN